MHRDLQSSPRGLLLHESKRALRTRILAARDTLPPEVRHEADRVITAHVGALESFQHARSLLITFNFGSEVSTLGIGRLALATGKRVIAPRVNATTKMLDLYQVRDLERDVEPGGWNVPEPVAQRCTPASPE